MNTPCASLTVILITVGQTFAPTPAVTLLVDKPAL